MLSPNETARILADEAERQQSAAPRLRIEAETASGRRVLYLRPSVSVEFDAWAWTDGRAGLPNCLRILSVQGA